MKASQLMYKEMNIACSVIHTEYTNAFCGENLEFLKTKPGGAYNKMRGLKGVNFEGSTLTGGTWSSVVVTALHCQSEGLGIDPQWCRWGFFPKLPTEPCALGST
jgi:hypothetical protein